MCDPLTLTIGSMAIGAASQVTGFMGQQQQASEQNAYYQQNRLNALQANADTQTSLNMRESQEQQAAADQKFETGLQVQAARATNITAAGENGVSGLSLEGLLNDISNKGARANANVDQNTDWTMAQLEAQKTSSSYQTVDRINSVKQATAPSLLDAGLKIAATGVDGYSKYSRWTQGGMVQLQ